MGQEKMNVGNQTLISSMAAMGGGIASSGGPCGALIGAVAFMGSLLGKQEPQVKDNPVMWRACYTIYKRFETEIAAKYDSVNCKDIAGVDWKDRNQVKKFYTGKGRYICADNTGMTARILGEVLEKYIK